MCPKYFKYKHIDGLKKPLTYLGFETRFHRRLLRKVIAEGMSLDEHLAEAYALLEDNQHLLISRNKIHCLDYSLFRARLIAKVWHRVAHKEVSGPFVEKKLVDVKVGRYTIHTHVDLFGGVESYAVRPEIAIRKQSSNLDTMTDLMHRALTSLCPKAPGGRWVLGTIRISLLNQARVPVGVVRRKRARRGTKAWGAKRALTILNDAMDMVNGNVFPRFNCDGCWCVPAYCEYWDVCWGINRAKSMTEQREDS